MTFASNDQSSQDDSKNCEIGEDDGILDSIIIIILNTFLNIDISVSMSIYR